MIGITSKNLVTFVAALLLGVSLMLTRMTVADPSSVERASSLFTSIFRPIDSSLFYLSNRVHFYWDHYLWLVDTELQLNDLAEELEKVKKENQRLTEIDRENQSLRKVLDFQSKLSYKAIIAEVIAYDPSSLSQTIVVDKGAADGLKAGLAVVDGAGLVGQTTLVSSKTSRVLLITDRASAVSVVLEKTRVVGIAEGTLGKFLSVDYLEAGTSIAAGDRFLTSGLDGVFPKGILVGELMEVRTSGGALFQQATLLPAASARRVELVEVLLPETIGPAPEITNVSSGE